MIQVEDWTIQEITGYVPQTTFYTDFSIADQYGLEAIQDTYNRSFNSWKNNYIYITELVMVLNWKIWRWYEHNEGYALLYNKLWEELDQYCLDHLKGEELEYYIRTTD